ncbi:hypothetical protein PS862_01080 [Pseudomonas fluorescens]|uniref:Uncharacterized protein n=1 Tax=Pseudomonas fluorescens TaxID=294 RepID=A0A5E6VFI0_PSEFL|nr:hypothetical protein [Pseudomonas fluorescens]VVN16657.1 hypothetical protein PS639_04072 [Pseudomonas fluorescens]VVO65988.1 hypothetical protein PS862_01080 [Pseudomonas fluorescens]
MSKKMEDQPTTCYFPEAETTLEITPDPDVSPEINTDAPAQDPVAPGTSNRRANFAAPESADGVGRKRSTGGVGGSGGIDSLGGGRLP